MKTKIFILLSFIISLNWACSPGERGSGDFESFKEIENANRLRVVGAINMVLKQGDQPSLLIRGEKDLTDELEIIQSGDLLELRLKGESQKKLFGKKALKVELTLAELSSLEFEGAGNLEGKGVFEVDHLDITGKGVGNIELNLEANSINAELNFVGNMELRGVTQEFTLLNEGVGNIDAIKLIAQKVDLNSKGIGAVSVFCEDELVLVVSGIGSVTYKGNPTVIKEDVSGLGKVFRN